MNLSVHVLGREVATLKAIGDFRSSMSYHPEAAPDDFVSLTMRVRPEPYQWDDVLHPIFQMNLPEGYLLQILQEQFGPHIGASPTALLAVIGRNMIGRIQVAPPGADLNSVTQAVDLKALLQGDNSEATFADLVRAHATSGVSGVVPKFLDNRSKPTMSGRHTKATIYTREHIIKGSTNRLPYIALNEYFCMQVARRVMPAAVVEVSLDGQALVVQRFDTDASGASHWGMEDFCALLGLRPAAKYETTWERIAKAVRDHVPASNQPAVFQQLACMLLLTYALRNADCHAKNIALRYTNRNDVHLAPAYDMITTAAYPEHAKSPPAISMMGSKTWNPGKHLRNFITAQFGVPVSEQTHIVDQIGNAMAEVAPRIRAAMIANRPFTEIGKRMLLCWQEGLQTLRDRRCFAMPEQSLGEAFSGLSDPIPVKPKSKTIGRSELLGRR